MQSVIYHMVSAACLNDSDKWFSLLDVGEPNDLDLEKFLDVADKMEEIHFQIQKN